MNLNIAHANLARADVNVAACVSYRISAGLATMPRVPLSLTRMPNLRRWSLRAYASCPEAVLTHVIVPTFLIPVIFAEFLRAAADARVLETLATCSIKLPLAMLSLIISNYSTSRAEPPKCM